MKPWCFQGTALCRSGSPYPRYGHATALLDGRMFVHGGRKSAQATGLLDGSTVEIIDLVSRTSATYATAWASGTSEATAKVALPSRAGHSLLVWDGKLVAIGGEMYSETEPQLQASGDVAVLDPLTLTWRRLSKGPSQQAGVSAGTRVEGVLRKTFMS